MPLTLALSIEFKLFEVEIVKLQVVKLANSLGVVKYAGAGLKLNILICKYKIQEVINVIP